MISEGSISPASILSKSGRVVRERPVPRVRASETLTCACEPLRESCFNFQSRRVLSPFPFARRTAFFTAEFVFVQNCLFDIGLRPNCKRFRAVSPLLKAGGAPAVIPGGGRRLSVLRYWLWGGEASVGMITALSQDVLQMRETLTISLPKDLRRGLEKMAKAEGVTNSEYVRRALKAEIFRRALRAARRELVPQARAQGVYTDEDVFKIVS